MSIEISKKTFAIQPAISNDEFDTIATSTRYLPRVQLYGSSSLPVKRGKFTGGHYGLVTSKDNIIDLGDSVDCLPLNFRAKALDTSGEKPYSIFDKHSDEFKDIAARSIDKNSKCMYGPEFLLWLPTQKKFATFFMCNPTMRRESPMLREQTSNQEPTTLKVQFIESKQYGGWHGPVVVPCSTPFELPTADEVMTQNELFCQKDAIIEEVSDEVSEGREV